MQQAETKPEPESRGLRLNLGCGSQRPEGWINVDSSPGVWLARHPLLDRLLRRILPARMLPAEDWSSECVSTDLTRRLPWPDGSAEAVYSSHLLEHLTRSEGRRLLEECGRVLRPGGRIRLVVPDLARVVDDYLSSRARNPKEAADRFHADTGYFEIEPPRSWSGALGFRIRAKNNHAFLYDEACLAATLLTAGFTDVRRRACGDSDIPDIADIDMADRFEGSLCLEAVRK